MWSLPFFSSQPLQAQSYCCTCQICACAVFTVQYRHVQTGIQHMAVVDTGQSRTLIAPPSPGRTWETPPRPSWTTSSYIRSGHKWRSSGTGRVSWKSPDIFFPKVRRFLDLTTSKYIPVHGFGNDDGLETTMTTMMMVWFGLVVQCKKLGKCNLIHFFFPTIEQHSGTVTFFVGSIIFILSYGNDNLTKLFFKVIFNISAANIVERKIDCEFSSRAKIALVREPSLCSILTLQQ